MKRELTTIIKPFLKTRESRLTLAAMDDYEAEDFLDHIRSNVMMGVLPLDAIANHGDLIAEEFGEYTGCEIDSFEERETHLAAREAADHL
jgi:hypothetical protein